MDQFAVLTPGAYTTVQDEGRFNYQHMGVPISGVLDLFACRVANMLVGNPAGCAVLEITIMGPRLEILNEADIAVTGADMGLSLNGSGIDGWSAIRVKPGDVVDIHQVKSGCRAYLAVTGGIDVPLVMNSRSTYVGAKIGGFMGRVLAAGDRIPRGPGAPLPSPRALPERWIPAHPTEIVLRAIPGPQNDFFDEGLATLFGTEYEVSAKADRMGYRLQGEPIVRKAGTPMSIISEPSVPGGIQIPADQQPIILLVEQTVGGYTKIATVISTDLSKVAQATPGDTIRFEAASLEYAHRLVLENRKHLNEIEAFLGNNI